MNDKKNRNAFLWLLGGVGLLILSYIGNGFDPSALLPNAMCALALPVGLILSRMAQTKTTQRAYLSRYQAYTLDSFSTTPKLRKKFADMSAAYANRRLRDAMKLLDELRPQCTTDNERFSVACFTGFCCEEMLLHEDAVRAYEYALQYHKYAALATNLGFCHERLENYDLALGFYNAATQIDPGYATAYNNSAQIYMRTGRYQQAIEWAEKAHAANPKLLPALNALAVCHFLLGNQEAYRKYLPLVQSVGGSEENLQNYIAKRQAADKKNLL